MTRILFKFSIIREWKGWKTCWVILSYGGGSAMIEYEYWQKNWRKTNEKGNSDAHRNDDVPAWQKHRYATCLLKNISENTQKIKINDVTQTLLQPPWWRAFGICFGLGCGRHRSAALPLFRAGLGLWGRISCWVLSWSSLWSRFRLWCRGIVVVCSVLNLSNTRGGGFLTIYLFPLPSSFTLCAYVLGTARPFLSVPLVAFKMC